VLGRSFHFPQDGSPPLDCASPSNAAPTLQWRTPELTRQKKIIFAEMRAAGVRGLLIYCSDYKCGHWTTISGDRGPGDVRLSNLESRFTCQFAAREAPTFAQISAGKKRRPTPLGKSPGKHGPHAATKRGSNVKFCTDAVDHFYFT
jgi:hypothetical protein